MSPVVPLELGAWRSAEHRRLTLRPHEVAFVLQISERDVAVLVRAGVLANVSRDSWTRLDPGEVFDCARERVARDELSPLALWALRDVVTSVRRVRRPATSDAAPEPLTQFIARGRTA
jgi:hypothetical protein